MARTAAPRGYVLSTGLQTIYSNPANSGRVETIEVQIANVDGANDVDITSFQFVDASSAPFHLLPVNYTLKAKTGLISIRKVLEPGDYIRGQASANDDATAVVDVIFSEPVTP